MSLTLKQFAGSRVTPMDDARLYSFALGGKTGIVEGVAVTHLGANQLKVSAGWGICHGRMFTVEETTINANVSTGGDRQGRLLINIDVSAETPMSFVTQTASALPALVQENINGSGTVYQLPLATYTIGEIAITNFVAADNTITDVQVDLRDVKTALSTLEKAVATAQSTADTAKTNAATAQSTANTAKTNAANAATAASNAQSTANTAKSTAEAAVPKSAFTLSGTTLTVTW